MVAAILTFVLPVGTAALIFMFQGLVAFPLLLLLERALGYRMVSRENTLQPLFIQVASIQLLALPAILVSWAPSSAPTSPRAVADAQHDGSRLTW